MPLKTLKKETADTLMLEWVLHVKDYKLTLDKNRCVGCQICSLACPKEAIKLEKQPKTTGEKAKKAKIDIDLDKCNFCGICDVLCPYGAIRVTLNDQHVLSILEKESFPQLIRDIRVDESKHPIAYVDCDKACPLGLIKVTWVNTKGGIVQNLSSLDEQERKKVHAKVEIEKERCPCCRVCEAKCPEGIIHVRKFLNGKVIIHPEKCPEDCRDCVDVCPITGALHVSQDKKVHVDENFCVYCGACKLVCPVNDALELKRTMISHAPVRSGAWNKALERLASTADLSKELHGKGRKVAVGAVKRLLEQERK